jgi:hypothetical protein
VPRLYLQVVTLDSPVSRDFLQVGAQTLFGSEPVVVGPQPDDFVHRQLQGSQMAIDLVLRPLPRPQLVAVDAQHSARREQTQQVVPLVKIGIPRRKGIALAAYAVSQSGNSVRAENPWLFGNRRAKRIFISVDCSKRWLLGLEWIRMVSTCITHHYECHFRYQHLHGPLFRRFG